MCGIAGVVTERRPAPRELSRIARRMADGLRHRGPDSDGVWEDGEAGVALGHRRLAIIDLSVEGHQPMVSASGRYVITYNGEIYNFLDLKLELEGLGHRFRGYSDTEMLLAALDQWGVVPALRRVVGMFAFGLYDRRERVVHLVSDRLGKKPLYFGRTGGDFLFASELKAFDCHPAFAPEVDRGALTLFLRHSCVPAPHSIYRGVFKLPPASVLSLSVSQTVRMTDEELLGALQSYWPVRHMAEAGVATPLRLDELAATDQLDELLGETVACRMISDVPLGALLSGGIDSSTVVSLMQKHAASPVRTFTVGFEEEAFNEAAGAKAVARHLGTDHTEIFVTPAEARAVIPELPEIYDEPFADQSQIPTYLVARLARQHVTVALSGDGGDEAFGGYNRHFLGRWLWRRLRFCPYPLRRALAAAMMSFPPDTWDALATRLDRMLPRAGVPPTLGYHMRKLSSILGASGPDDLYRQVVSRWEQPNAVVRGASEPVESAPCAIADPALRMMFRDTVGYLPDDILVKVDRASMAVSLEVRAPLLDHRVTEFAWRLPLDFKIRGRQGKWLLRQVLYRYVPQRLVDRPKQGFDIPLDAWLRGPLRGWAETLLDARRLDEDGFFDPMPIRQVWAEHLAGRHNWGTHLWTVLMFQAWHDRWLSGRIAEPAAVRPLTAATAS